MDNPLIRVAIADDDAMVRSALRGYLQSAPDIECVGEATHAEEAAGLVRAGKVDVLVLDLLMPGSRDLEALHLVRAACPHVRVIVLSGYPAARYAASATLAGATAYLEKANGPADRIVREIRAAIGSNRHTAAAQARPGDAAPLPAAARVESPREPVTSRVGSETEVDPENGGGHAVPLTVFRILLVVVSISMMLPLNTLHLIRSQTPWLDAAASQILDALPFLNLDHVVGFGALGACARFAYPRATPHRCVLLLVTVAALTELVQNWSPGRDPEITHVILAGLASLAGWGVAYAASMALGGPRVDERPHRT